MEPESSVKGAGEYAYWKNRKDQEGELLNHWFRAFYTDHFGLSVSDYSGKRVLDLGCGPRGSLEWATGAEERVGLDPLADIYLGLGASKHGMDYVASGAEAIPFPDGYFDIVCSFNSLDHVEDVGQVIEEIKRVVSVGGLVLLLTDVHEEPTPQEPAVFDWSILDRFRPELMVQSMSMYEKREKGMYASVQSGIPFDHADPTKRYGILSARFIRVPMPDGAGPARGWRKER